MKTAIRSLRTHPFMWAIWMFIVGFSISRGFTLTETDVFWQAQTGLETLQNGKIPSIEHWNWLVQGKQWLPNSWLWNVVLALGYKAFGTVGLALVTTLSTAAVLALVIPLLKFCKASEAKIFVAVVAESVFLISWLSGRPQVWDYLMLLCYMLLAARFRKHPHSYVIMLAGAFLFSVLWMNMHLTAPLAAVMFPLIWWVFNMDRTFVKKILPAVGLAVVSFAGSFVTPFGISGLTKGFFVADQSTGVESEWMPLTQQNGEFAGVLVLVYIAAVIVLFFSLKSRQWVYSAAVLVLGLAAFQAVRFAPFLGILLLLSAVLNVWVLRKPLPAKFRKSLLQALCIAGNLSAAAFLISGVILGGMKLSNPDTIPKLDPSSFSSIPQNARVLTLQNGGAEMILYRPDVQTTMDGRNDVIGKKNLFKIVDLYYNDKPAKIAAFLKDNKVDAVFVDKQDAPSKLPAILKKLDWSKKVVPAGWVYLHPSS